MNHFSDEKWLDFSRELLPADEMEGMRSHLDSGCKKCIQASELWRAVTQIATREPEYLADESAVAAAKRAFRKADAKPTQPASDLIAAIIFDSFLAGGAVAGIRSGPATARHLLYSAGQVRIEVRLDQDGKTTLIIGQVLETDESGGTRHRDWRVSLLHFETTLARTVVNSFGEFEFESQFGSDLRVRLEADENSAILTLPD